jgi:two-component system LytT family response regulator
MIRAIIVDDENKSRVNLKILLTEFCEGVEVIGLAGTVNDAIKLIDSKNPDMVFLDIQMQNETGFDLLEHYEKINFEVVFTTAHSEYALRAIKFSAIDYLLKPIDIDDLQAAVKKLEERINADSQIKNKLEVLLQNLKPEDSSNCKIALPSSSGLVFVKLREILYCEGQSNYTYFYLINGNKYIVSKTLKEYEEMLSEYNFFRIHKSHLVNLNEIKQYVRGDGGYVVMNNEKALDVSKRRKESFLLKISQMI